MRLPRTGETNSRRAGNGGGTDAVRRRAVLAQSAAELAAAESGLQEAWSILAADARPKPKDVRRGARAFAELYTAWDRLEPGTGRDQKAREWAAKAEAGR